MELSAAVLAVVLLSQAGQGARPATVARPTPIELAAASVRLPADASRRFRDVGLSEVLDDAPREAGLRVAVVQDYWRLWRAFADRALAERNIARLKPLLPQVPAGVEANLTAAELATAEAQLAEAELAIREAQVALSAKLGWNASGTMPRPLDPPHVGTYNTLYETIYQRRTPTERALMIHQTLPIYYAALGAHGTARQAADDMVAAQEASFQRGEINIEALLAAWQAQTREEKELYRLTLKYNELIAEYAVPLAGPDVATPRLVRALIRNDAPTASRPNPRAEVPNVYDREVEPVEYAEPAAEETAMPPGELDAEATGAAQEWPAHGEQFEGGEQYQYGDEQYDNTAPPVDGGFEAGTPAGYESGEGVEQQQQQEAIEDPFPASDGSARFERNTRRRFAAKLVLDTAAQPIFAGVSPTQPSTRALIEKMLARTYVGDQGETRLPLSKCLGAVASSRYAELLDAYTEAWRTASNNQANADSLAQIQVAQKGLLKRLGDPTAAQDMLVLRAAETAYTARLIEGEAEIWEAMKGLGAVALPNKPGAKALPVDEPPVWAAMANSVSKPALDAKARGLIAEDAARAQACREIAETAGLTGLTLQAIERQNEETRGFIDLTARAARTNGTEILAQLGPNATASAAHRALMGTPATNAARAKSGTQNRP